MKIVTLFAATLACLELFSADLDEKDGGLVRYKGSGFVAVIDCRESTGTEYIDGLQHFKNCYAVDMRVFKGNTFAIHDAKKQLESTEGNAAIFIVDDLMLPMTLLAGEEKWTMINVAKVKTSDRKLLSHRLSLLFVRQVARVIGTDTAPEFDICFHQAFEGSDLDKITKYDFTAGAYVSMNLGMKALGIEPIEMITYREACELGIAQPPTNDIQKAVWKEVHEPPKKPIKITYDKDKQKPVVK